MAYLIQQLLNGVGTAVIYASLGLALVLVYRTTTIANFAQGEMATFAAYMVWQALQFGIPVWLAVLGGLSISALFGVCVYLIIVAPVQNRDELTIIIVTLGLFLVFNSVSGAIWGYVQRSVPSIFPAGVAFDFAGGAIQVTYALLGGVILLSAVAAAMYVLFQKTKLGLGLRAAASNPESARAVGVPFIVMMACGWAGAAVLGTFSALLIAPRLTLDPNMMIVIIVFAFAAAVVGGLGSYKGAIVGGLVVAEAQSLSVAYLPILGADLQIIVPLALIVIVLLIKPDGIFGHRKIKRV